MRQLNLTDAVLLCIFDRFREGVQLEPIRVVALCLTLSFNDQSAQE